MIYIADLTKEQGIEIIKNTDKKIVINLEEAKHLTKEETVSKFVKMQTEMNELGIDFREQYSDWILKHSNCESQDLQKLNEPQLQSIIKAYGALIKGYKEKIAKS